MTTDVIHNKVHYKIFDRTHQSLSLIFSKFKFTDAAKLAEVALNRQIVTKELGATAVYIPKQVHGKEVMVINKDTDFSGEVEADAVITATPGVAIAVQTADCVPVLLSCEKGKVVGALHCGWRGAKSGIIKAAAGKMYSMGAGRLRAVIGPSIQQCSYEVDSGYYNEFLRDNQNHAQHFIPSVKQTYHMFDLPAFVINLLKEQSIEIFKHINEDTYSLSEKYPSYRRSCHTDEKYEHHLLSAIIIKNE